MNQILVAGENEDSFTGCNTYSRRNKRIRAKYIGGVIFPNKSNGRHRFRAKEHGRRDGKICKGTNYGDKIDIKTYRNENDD